MAAHRTTPNGIASYSAGDVTKGPLPARITPQLVRIGHLTFRRVSGEWKAGHFKLLSYTLTPKDIPE